MLLNSFRGAVEFMTLSSPALDSIEVLITKKKNRIINMLWSTWNVTLVIQIL